MQFVTDWANGPDGSFIVYQETSPATRGDLIGCPYPATAAQSRS